MKSKFDPDKFLNDVKEFDPDAFLREIGSPYEAPPVKEEGQIGDFSEENPLIKGAYSISSRLSSILDKPRSAILGPAIQAATFGHPIETIKKEYTSLEPQPESSFVGRARELIPGQTPIMDPYAKDVAEGESVKAAAKMWLEQKFPKAYGVMSNIVPSDVPAMAADVALSQKLPEIPVSKMASKISSRLEDAASLNREKSLINEVDLTGSKAAKDIAQLKTQKIGNTIERYGLDRTLSNPVELKDALSGKKTLQVDSSGNEVIRTVSKGIIDQLGDELRAGSEFLTEKVGPVDVKEIADNVVEKMTNLYKKESSGVPFNQMDAQKLKDSVYSILKVGPENNNRSFESLIDSKRSSAKFYFDLKNDPATPAVAGPSLTATHKAIWDEIDNYVNQKAGFDPDVKGFARQNSDMSDLLQAEEMLLGAREKSLKAPSMLDIGVGAGLGYGVGQMVARPEYGAFIGGGIGAMRGMAGQVRETVPARLARMQKGLANKVAPITSIPAVSPTAMTIQNLPSNNQGRAPQSVNVPSIQQQMMMRRNLVENLADFEIPRSSKDILNNKELVFAKVAQATNDPQILDGLKDALDKHPEKLKTVLPVMVTQFPNIFSADKYNRVDGRIFHPDPMMQEKLRSDAKMDIEAKKGQMSNTERIMLLNGINRDGSLPDSFN